MNCDEAFDRMTSAGAASDAALQLHLSGCRRCRAMQETLSPAMDWLATTSNGLETRAGGLERSSVFLTDEAVQVAERVARRLSSGSSAAQQRVKSRYRIVRWVAVSTMAVIGLFAVVTSISTKHLGSPAQDGAVRAASACLWLTPADVGSQLPPTADQVVATCVACHLTLP